MPDGKSTCDASLFTMRTSSDGRTGSFRDCRRAYVVGRQVSVVWSPTDPGAVIPHVMEPVDVAVSTGEVAPVPLVVAGLAVLLRRRFRAPAPSRPPLDVDGDRAVADVQSASLPRGENHVSVPWRRPPLVEPVARSC